MDFPRLVYRGPTKYLLVQDETGYAEALSAGWNHGHAEPVAAAPAISPVGNSESDGDTKQQEAAAPDDAPPTRDEMLAQLAKLGVDVDKRWGDKRLAAEIAKAMEAK